MERQPRRPAGAPTAREPARAGEPEDPAARIWAEIVGEDGQWSGVVVDTDARGIRVAFGNVNAPRLRMGASVNVTLDGGPLRAPFATQAVVASRNDGERVEYGLTVRDPARVARLMPPVASAPNRRKEPRLIPPGSVTWVTVIAVEGPCAGRRAAGTLLDVSAHGLGMLLDVAAEGMLSASPTVTCTYAAPGRTGQRVRAGTIVNRALLGTQIRYGVAFVGPDESEVATPVEAYEPAWDCAACGTRLLLGTTHLCCPGCGVARGDEPVYFPDWEESDLNTEHWAWGEERPCPFCAVSFSDLACFCGRCGRPLA